MTAEPTAAEPLANKPAAAEPELAAATPEEEEAASGKVASGMAASGGAAAAAAAAAMGGGWWHEAMAGLPGWWHEAAAAASSSPPMAASSTPPRPPRSVSALLPPSVYEGEAAAVGGDMPTAEAEHGLEARSASAASVPAASALPGSVSVASCSGVVAAGQETHGAVPRASSSSSAGTGELSLLFTFTPDEPQPQPQQQQPQPQPQLQPRLPPDPGELSLLDGEIGEIGEIGESGRHGRPQSPFARGVGGWFMHAPAPAPMPLPALNADGAYYHEEPRSASRQLHDPLNHPPSYAPAPSPYASSPSPAGCSPGLASSSTMMPGELPLQFTPPPRAFEAVTPPPGVLASPQPGAGWLRSPRVQPSFPKTTVTPQHVEIRAGWRLRPEAAEAGARADGEGDDTGPSDSGPLEVSFGLGINTGAGVRDGSLGVKLAGTGMQIGRKVGISFFDNEISIDFSKLWSGWGGSPAGDKNAAGGQAGSSTPGRSPSPRRNGAADRESPTPSSQADAAWELAQLKSAYEQKLEEVEEANRAVLQRQMQQKQELVGSPGPAVPSVHAV